MISSTSNVRTRRRRIHPETMSEKAMDRHIRICLNRAALISSSIASLILLLLYLRTPTTCVAPENYHHHDHHLLFPRSSCDHTHRDFLSVEHKNHRLWSSSAWHKKVSSLAHLFASIHDLGLLFNHSHVLCVSAGAGHDVAALQGMIDVGEVAGVDLVASPPLVDRADPHNLPFFDGAFDLSFTSRLGEALFPSRFAAEMERVVARGGACVVVVAEEDFDEEVDVKEVVKLFTGSRLVQAKKGSLTGSKVTRIIMKKT